MQDIKPQEVFANLDFQAAPGNDVEDARQCVRHALSCAFQAFADQDGSKNLAVLFQADPLSAEIEFKDCFLQMGCTMLSGAFESFDHGPSVEVEGIKYTKTAPTTGQATTTLGPVKFKRPRYRRTNRQGESFFPTEHQLGLTEGNQTPAAARLSMALISSVPARESADLWKRFVGEGPSTGTLVRLSGVAGRCLEECSPEVMDELRKQEELPENASMVQVGLDGVMMRMNAEKNGDEVIVKRLARGVMWHRYPSRRRRKQVTEPLHWSPTRRKKAKSQNTNPPGTGPFTEPESGPETGGHRRW